MKRVFAFILACILMMTAGSAFAQETRERTVMLEGIEETITETMYLSPNGFSLWYPADLFKVVSEYGHETIVPADETIENVSLMIVPVDIPVEESEAFIYEATGGYMEDEAEISEVQEGKLDSGLDVKSVQAALAEEIHRFYLITGADKVFCLTAMFPIETAEGFGARMEQIISTFDIAAAE